MEMDIGSSVIALTFAGAKDQTHSNTKWLLSPSTSHFFLQWIHIPLKWFLLCLFAGLILFFEKKGIKPGHKVCRGCHLFKHMFVFSAQTKNFQKCPAIPLMKLALNGNFLHPKVLLLFQANWCIMNMHRDNLRGCFATYCSAASGFGRELHVHYKRIQTFNCHY